MRVKPKLEFGNFTLKFGEHNLLDFAEEIVIPAFIDPNFSREVIAGTYKFIDVIVHGDRATNTVFISGRFVRSSKLESDAKMEDNKLVPQKESIDHAVHSYFSLVLNSHRLLYVRQGIDPPGMEAFENTAKKVIKEHWKLYIKREFDKQIENIAIELKVPIDQVTLARRREVMSALKLGCPEPRLSITPLASDRGLSEIIDRAGVVNSLKIRFGPLNNEMSSGKIIEALREAEKQTGAEEVTQTHTTSDKEKGLEKDGVKSLVQGAAPSGQAQIEIGVTDDEGVSSVHTNDDVRLRVPFPIEKYNSPESAALAAYAEHDRQIGREMIAPPRPEDDTETKISRITEWLFGAGRWIAVRAEALATRIGIVIRDDSGRELDQPVSSSDSPSSS